MKISRGILHLSVVNRFVFCYNGFGKLIRVGWAVAGHFLTRGKSEQVRAWRWVTPTRSDPRESASENTQPMVSSDRNTGKGEMVR